MGDELEHIARICRAVNTMQAIGHACNADCRRALLDCIVSDVEAMPRKAWRMDYGNENSGNHGHAGRPGKVGGSAPAGEGGGEEEAKEAKPEKEESAKSGRDYQEGHETPTYGGSYEEETTPDDSPDWIDPETESYLSNDPKRVKEIENLFCDTYYEDRISPNDKEEFKNNLADALDRLEDETTLRITDTDGDGNEYAKAEIYKDYDGRWKVDWPNSYNTQSFESTDELAQALAGTFDASNVYKVKEVYSRQIEPSESQWSDNVKAAYEFYNLPNDSKTAWNDRAEQTVKAWEGSTQGERQALRDYTSEDYQWINQLERGTFMRTDLHSKEELREKSDNLANLIDKCEMKETTQLIRGVDYDALAGMVESVAGGFTKSELRDMDARKLGKMLVGQTIVENGFLSCSSGGQSKYGDREVRLKVLCPEGTKGVYAEPFSNWGQKWNEPKATQPPPLIRDENETILQRGTALHIDNVEKSGKYVTLYARVVAQGGEELAWEI